MRFTFQLITLLSLFAITHIPSAFAESAIAIIRGTADDSPISGTAMFESGDGGVQMTVQVANVPAGKHGFHIHEFGNCADLGNAAGSHYNPDGTAHGYLPDTGMEAAHAGDFGNIEVDSDGTGMLQLKIPGLRITGGQYNVAGRAVILHEKEDDFGQPLGNAGGRIGCGSIIVVE